MLRNALESRGEVKVNSSM